MSDAASPRGYILVVDDDPLIPRRLSEKLSREGFDCHTRSSGQEALTLLQDKKCDLLISDLQMPGLSGMQHLVPAAAIVLAQPECYDGSLMKNRSKAKENVWVLPGGEWK